VTSGHPLRRMLARICSAETMSRVVDPTLADMRWEDGKVTWRGCAALVRALTLHTATSLPAWCAAVWTDDEHAIPRAAAFVLLGAILVAALVLIWPTVQVAKAGGSAWMFFFTTLPRALAGFLPPAIVIAIPLALRRRHIGVRLLRRTLVLLLLFVGMMFGLVGYTTRPFQSYYPARRQVAPPRQPNETVEAARQRLIHDLGAMNDAQEKALVAWGHQSTLAQIAAVVPFGVAALAIYALPFGRRRPLVAGLIGVLVYVIPMAVMQSVRRMSVADGSVHGAVLWTWAPNAILLIASCAILGVRHTRGRTVTAA
jgi:hypothetical protein